jgi:hypothetical protein
MAGTLKRSDLKILSKADLYAILRDKYKIDGPETATAEELIDLIISKQNGAGERSNQDIVKAAGL